MYLNPFRDFVKKVVNSGVSRRRRRSSRSRMHRTGGRSQRQAPFTVAAELCEARQMLAAPPLITVAPNTGGYITNGTIETTAPTQLTFTFTPAATIVNTPANLSNITVTRAGADHALGTVDDQAVQTGSITVDSQNPNVVTLRFANSLVDDTYRIKVASTLQSSTGSFNSGDQIVDFTIDFGGQVVSVVPQPVVRTEILNVIKGSQVADLQTFSLSLGGGTPVNFQFKNTTTASVVAAGNIQVSFDPTSAGYLANAENYLAGQIASAIDTQAGNVASPLFNTLSTPVVSAGATVSLTGSAFTANLTLPSSLLNISSVGSITDGDKFTVVTQSGKTATFQFKDTTTASIILPGNVGINYSPGVTAATLANSMVTAINGSSLGAGTVSLNGAGVKFNGNPSITLATTNSTFLTAVGGLQVKDGAITPLNDTINVYFSQQQLVDSLVKDAAFYQVINTVDGSILQPNSVKYDSVGNTAVLKFSGPLPTGTMHLTIGAPRLNNTTVDRAFDAGTVFNNDGMAPLTGNLFWINGSASVFGAGTFFSQLNPGDILKGPDGNAYKVRSVTSNGFLTLTTAFTGSSAFGVTSRYLFMDATNPVTVAGNTAWVNGSASVTGNGTTFLSSLKAGNLILGPDGSYYIVSSITSDTLLTLTDVFAGAGQPLFTTKQLVTTATGATALGGTTTWSSGSPAVTGAGTSFLNHLQIGQMIIGPDDNFYTVSNILSNTSLTLSTNYVGPTQAGQTALAVPYSAFTTVGYIGDVAGSSTDPSAFALYKFTTAPGVGSVNATINVSDLATAFGGNVLIKVFDATGTTLLGSNATNNSLSLALSFGTTYIVGISGVGNVYNPVTGVSTTPGTGTGSFKLTIGVANTFNANPQTDTTSFATSNNLGSLGAAGFSGVGKITPVGSILYPPFPGGSDTPGNGSTQDTLAAGMTGERTDANPGTTPAPLGTLPTLYYNFQDVYGSDPQGSTLHNAITENQKNLARQIFDMYGQYLGVKFVETLNTGFIIVTGDARAIAPGIDPTSVGGIAGNGVAIMNGQIDYQSSPYGGQWMQIAFHEIGHLLGLNHSFDAPGVMGGGAEQLSGGGNAFPLDEPVFPGDIALVPAKVNLPPHSVDFNTYKFTLNTAGTLTAETLAQRLVDAQGNANPSLLDTVITLYSDATAQATAVDTFGVPGFSMTFTAKALGTAGNGLSIIFTKSDLGANKLPKVTVNGSTISIVLNTNANASGAGTTSTAQNLIDAIANDDLAKNLLTAAVTAGSTSQQLGNQALTPATANLNLLGGQGSRTIIARNDDYFGRDSFVSLHLAAGNYFVTVSSTGNTDFNPMIPDSGFNGRTDGTYQLKLNFTADPLASQTLNDLGGVALDGDGGNTTGGTFNFWFQSTSGGTGKTFYVDKANLGDINQDGSSADPYGTISDALQAAAAFAQNNPGVPTILRIVGNGGFDGNVSSTADSLPYLIGFDSQGGNAQDGSTFIIPENVTVMIDAGAVLKLHSAIIDVGNTVPGVDRDGGALQVLGTPRNNVIFTSLFDDAIGGRSDQLNFNPKAAGDWGGLVYRQGSDFQGKDWLGNGVYLNSVNQSVMTYGGGQVFDGSVLQVFDPIYLANPTPTAKFFARPAVWFNTIQFSAGAAISADPNSFANTEDRSGPDVYGNLVINDTINGFFVRIRTNAGQPIDTLGISARIQHTDITYVLAENLFLVGNPGGPYEPDPFDATHTGWQARLGASLVLDPGVVLKVSGARIEAQVGQSQLIAEGTSTNSVVFTSLADDIYGANGVGAGFTNTPGTFDTNNDLKASTGKKGDWGGIFYNSDSKGSIDHAVVQYAGGTSPIAGGFAQFNPIEIQQATVRIANTLFSNNAGGDPSLDVDPTREGLQTNDLSTIFVRGAQPVLIDNVFIKNAGAIVSINANALNSDIVPDWGRSTGFLDAFTGFSENHGPLVALNKLVSNDINGMRVRGEEITTQTFWDDTDIVHVLQSQIDDVINQHTFGGITLESNASGSLVVKLSSGGGFFVNGIPLDIADRIGGAIQIVGTASNPVILTSLKDDKVGAGFQPNGKLVTDTNNDGALTQAAAGDWNGITLGPYSNDRNVITEFEAQSTTTSDNNGTSSTAQFLGNLAPDLATDTANNPNGGNDYQPLGFAVHGSINQPSDVDVYSFNAATGTEVWLDLGLTSPALASIIELVDANGVVLARSSGANGTNTLTSFAVTALSMMKDPNLGGDFYTSNPHDAGMRLILPGAPNTTNTYFVRVRSDQGLSLGQYELQVRLRQQWESPGSLIQYSTISFATTGIQVNGLPNNSPLAGDTASVGTNNSLATAQNIGNMLASNQNSITLAGNLQAPTQVDWYRFTLTYDLIEAIPGFNAGGKTWSTIFDINYAAGLTRPDTTISVFDSTGRLILVSRDSDVTTNQPQPLEGSGLTNLAGGSNSVLDPYIGSAQMPAGTPGSGNFTYYVAISSNFMLPTALDATFTAQSGNTQVRLEPVESVKRIVEDHIGFTGFTTGDKLQLTTSNLQPTTGAILPIDTTQQVSQLVGYYNLSDVVMYTVDSSNGHLRAVDPFSGKDEYDIGTAGNFLGRLNIKTRSDGTIWAYNGIIGDTGNVGQIYQIDPASGATLATLGSDAIADKGATDTDPNHLTSDQIDSFVWVQNGIGQYDLYVAVHDGAGTYNSGFGASRLYRANPANGAAVVANTPFNVRGELTTSTGDATTGFMTGMESLNGAIYGVTSTGKFVQIFGGAISIIKDLGSIVGGFTGLNIGPQNLANPNNLTQLGFYKNMLFATTTNGTLVALDTSGNFQAIFAGGNTSAGTFTGGFGLAFSPLDFNLWHPTMNQFNVAGHGINPSFDQSRSGNQLFTVNLGPSGIPSNEQEGGASWYFGLENWIATPVSSKKYMVYGVNAQYGVATQAYQQSLSSNNAASGLGNNYNLPGGAHGSLVSQSFSLTGYSSNDFPTLYFNYLLDTEGDTSHAVMNDSARVFISKDNGVTWDEVATNNISPVTNQGDLGPASGGYELPPYITPTVNANLANPSLIQQQVQPLYGTNQWRQARIDLSNYAGQANLRLRYDFSTSGTTYADLGSGATTQGQPGDQTGAGPNDKSSAQNNAHVGWYIDDIIVGLANRGEMVTADVANANPGFSQLPQNPAFGGPKQSLTGPYELDIRSGTEYAVSISGISPNIVVTNQYDANQRFVAGTSLTAPAGNSIVDGATFTIGDGVKSVTFEFDSNNVINGAGNQRVAFTTSDASPVVARSIRDAINAAATAGKFKVVAEISDGTITGTGFLTVSTNSTVDLIYAVSVSSAAAAPALTASITGVTTISENGGTTSTTGVVTRAAGGPALTVALSLVDTTTGLPSGAATITPTVTFGVGATTSSIFTINSVNNGLVDGLRTLAVIPTANGFTSVSAPVNVTDDEKAQLSLSAVTPVVFEGFGTGTATVTRNTVAGLNSSPLIVTVTSLDPTRLQMISGVQSGASVTVTIPAGQTSATFNFKALVNGTQGDNATVGFAAASDGFQSTSATTFISDTTSAAGLTPQLVNGTNVDTTPGVANNQTNGAIAIDPDYSVSSDFNTGGAVSVGIAAQNAGPPGNGIKVNFTTQDLKEQSIFNVALQQFAGSNNVIDGQFITVNDGVNGVKNFQFFGGTVSLTPGNFAVPFTPITIAGGSTAAQVATSLANAINGVYSSLGTGLVATAVGSQCILTQIAPTPFTPVVTIGTVSNGSVAISHASNAPLISVVGQNVNIILNSDAAGPAPAPTTAQALVNAINNFDFSPFPSAAIRAGISSGTANTSIAASPPATLTLTQALFQVSTTEGAGALTASYSTDGGTTWTSRPIATGAGTGDAALPIADGNASKPTVTTDNFGNLFLAYRSSNGPSLVVAVSADFGKSFSLVQTMGLDVDSPRLVAGNGYVWLAYRLNSGDVIQVKAAQVAGLGNLPGGATAFTGAGSITENVTASNGVGANFPSIAMGPNGQVAVAWAAPAVPGPGTQIYIAVDADGSGVSGFGPRFNAAVSSLTFPAQGVSQQGNGSINAAPDIAWDHTATVGGLSSMYLVYVDSNALTKTNVILKSNQWNTNTSTFAQSWAGLGAVPVNDDTNNSEQFMPRVAVDNFKSALVANPTQGDVVVTWLDSRNGGASQVQEFAAVYSRTGLTLGNVPVSGLINAGSTTSGIGLGNYTGLDFFNGAAFPLWSDNTAALAGNTGLPRLDEATQNLTVNPSPAALPKATVTITGPITQGTTGVNAGLITLSAPAPLGGVTILLTSSDTTIATVPASVNIGAGLTTANFNVTAVSFGATAYVDRTAIITGSVSGYESVAGKVDIIGGPTPALTISNLSSTSVLEGNTITGRVTRNTPTAGPLIVTLYSTSPSHLATAQPFTFLTTVIIPAGQTFIDFTLTGVQDYQVNGDVVVNFLAAAEGYVPDSAAITVVDSLQTLFTSYQLKGDAQTVRQQGHLQIIDNTIANSLNYGIAIDSGARIPANLPHPGSVRNLPTLNSQGLVPAPNIVNNVIYYNLPGNNFSLGGILFSGDPNAPGLAPGAVPYGRIVNNTLYGGTGSNFATGITVENNASPTIMNNIVANYFQGITVDASSSSTVVATEVYQNNPGGNLLGVSETNPINLLAGATLFVNPAKGNFYLKEGGQAIDASLNTLQDRASITAVLSAIGLPPSPIIAPTTDRFGQLRVDDPFVPNASGLGQNIFIDRGAVERADFAGPSAQLVTPLDNGLGDGDPTVNNVFITTTTPLPVLQVRLNDNAAGIDNSTVLTSAFILKQNGVTLADGVDYKFVYDPNTHIVSFQSVSVFPSSATFTITIPKVNGVLPIADLAGNPLQPNQADGTELFTIVGNVPPTLNSVNNISAVKDVTKDVTYASLLAAASPLNLSIAGGHTPEFLITAVTNGTLTITKTSQLGSPTFTVVPGSAIAANNTNVVEPGDVLHWLHSGFTGTEVGFSVVGYDPQNHIVAPVLDRSANPVPVSFNVVDPTPLLASDATLGLAAINPVGFPISYATLVSNLGATWIEATGNQQQLQVTGTLNGTLKLNGVPQGAFPFLVSPNDVLTWTPPVALPGAPPPGATALVPAFTVKAYDAFNAANFPSIPAYTTSTTTRTVNVNVLNVNPPTVTTNSITLGPKAQFAPVGISYGEIQVTSGAALGAGNAGDTLGLRIESIQAGTLQITHLGVTSNVVVGTTLILPGDVVTWNPPAGATGVNAAFTVSAFDVEKNLDGFVNVAVNVQLVNVPPLMSFVSTLQQADAQTPFAITYPMLIGASDAHDDNSDVLTFGFSPFTAAQIADGTLQILKVGNNSPVNVVPGTTFFAPGDILTWTPKPGISGNAVNAFNVFAKDPFGATSASVQVNIKVRALGTAFDLSGPWVVENASGSVLGLGRLTQTGASLTMVNFNGQGTGAAYTALNKIVAASYDGQTNVVGTIDINAADEGRILWADGTVWLRVSLGGTYAVSTPGNPNVSLGTISQNGVLLTFSNNGNSTTGTIQNSSQILVVTNGPNPATETYGDGRINFANGPQGFAFGGQTWTKLDLPPDYNNPGGSPVHIIQNGTSTFTFVDKFGNTSPGFWTSPTQVFATAWNESATVGNGKLVWNDGTVWTENVLLNGSKNGSGKTTITATPSIVGVSDYTTSFNNAVVHVVQTGTTNVVFVDRLGNMVLGTFISPTQVLAPGYGNLIATFSPGKITWSEGTVWTLTAPNPGSLTVTDYTNPNGVPVHIVRNNTNNLCIVDGLGRTSLGTMLDAVTGTVFLYPGDLMHFSGNTVTWDDGFVWTQVATVPPMITFTDTNGTSFHVKLTSRTTLIALDGPMKNLTATRLNGKLLWSNGAVWDNWDFNDLNALFQMTTGYP